MESKKNIAICAYGEVGKELSKFIIRQKRQIENIKFVCLLGRDKKCEEIKNLYDDANIKTFKDINVNSEEFRKTMLENKIDIVFLLWWPTIVKKISIETAKIGFVNLHPSLLPFNRGMHPYYWSIVENTPAGVSIHFINKNIDEGMLICQKEINKNITMTGEKLYSLAQIEIIKLFKKNYVNIIKGEYNTKEIKNSEGTFHYKKELNLHSKIDLEKKYKAIDLINIVRARSFNGNPSSFFIHEGKKYYINIKITEEKKDENNKED